MSPRSLRKMECVPCAYALCIRKDESLVIGHHRPTISGTISDLAFADEAIQNSDQVGMGAGFVLNRPGGILPGAAAREFS